MRTPLVFSIIKEQSLFMTAIMSLLTFLSILSLGIALSIGNGVSRWNSQWDLFATVQIMSDNNVSDTMKIIKDNQEKIVSVNEVSKEDMEKMLRPWMSGTSQLGNYLPKMLEVKFKTKSDLKNIGEQISEYARFMPHAQALKNSSDIGMRMIFISTLVLIMVLGSIGICISYIAKNTALLHKRELEILSQVGAKDSFIAKQMQMIVAKICLSASGIGLLMAFPVMAIILSAVQNARVGLMAMMGLGTFGWTILIFMPVMIIVFAIFVTKKTTLNILKDN